MKLKAPWFLHLFSAS